MAYGKKKIEELSGILIPCDVITETSGEEGSAASAYDKRNKKLVARFYYYIVIKKVTLEATHVALAEDFDISTKHISNLLKKNSDDIKALRSQAPKIEWFRKEFPAMSW